MRMLSGFSHFRSVASIILLIGVSVGMASAQGSGGGIRGIVVDPGAAVVSGATVTATNLETGFVRKTVTGGDGIFLLPLIDPGRYRLEVVAKGFKTLTREPVEVRVTETTDLHEMALEVGTVAENVIVTGEAQILQTTDATLGKVFDQRMVTDLPLVTRNFTQLLSLQAGVVADLPNATAFGYGAQGFSVGGSRLVDNSILIDGDNAVGSVTASSLREIGPGALGGTAIVSPDAVEEFKTQTNLYSAEFGRAGGSSVALVTKNGTTNFHGNLYEFFRNEILDANDYFLKSSQLQSGAPNKAPLLRQNQFGGTFGGPIRKDKTFFFVSYEGMRQLNGATPGFFNILPRYPLLPTDRSSATVLSQELGTIYGGRKGFPVGVCALNINCIQPDGSNINPLALNLLMAKLPNGQYLLPSFPSNGFNDNAGGLNGGQVFSNATFLLPGRFNEDQFNVNVLHLISNRQTLSEKFFFSNGTGVTPGAPLPGFDQTSTPQTRHLVLADTYTVSPTLVNEFRFGFLRTTAPFQMALPIKSADVGWPQAPGGSDRLAEVEIISPGVTIGNESSFTYSKENIFSYSDTVSKVVGPHTLRFGGSFLQHRLAVDTDDERNGRLLMFNFQDFLLGQDGQGNNTDLLLPGGVSNLLGVFGQVGSFARVFHFKDLSAFLQDDWKVRRTFTLNLGLRYDFFAWPTDEQDRIAGFDPRLIEEGPFGIPPGNQSFTGFTIAKDFTKHFPGTPVPPGVALVNDTGVYKNSLLNFGPRVGFAWQPLSRTSVRGGYGIFYPRVSAEAAIIEERGHPFNFLGLTTFSGLGTLQDPYSHLNLPAASNLPMFAPRQYTPNTQASLFLNPLDPRALNPYVQQWNLTIQYEVARNLLLEIGYMGSHGLRLMNVVDANQMGIASSTNPIRGVTTNTSASGNLQDRAPIAGLLDDRGLALTETNAESSYNALVASVSKRYSHGLQFLSSFTWGKSIDNQSGTPNGDLNNNGVPGDNTTLNHFGLSDFDREFRSVTTFSYELPNPRRIGSPMLNTVIGGWRMDGVMTFQTGNPITFLVIPSAVGSAVKSNGNLTPDLTAGSTLDDVCGSGPIENRLNGYFKTPALGQPGTVFAAPGPLDYGQLGRGLSCRQPSQKSVDFSLNKQISINERWKLNFRWELFNLFNWVNFGGANSVVSDAGYGLIRSTTTAPRIMQFALKLNF
jgi:hypothetical protein